MFIPEMIQEGGIVAADEVAFVPPANDSVALHSREGDGGAAAVEGRVVGVGEGCGDVAHWQ